MNRRSFVLRLATAATSVALAPRVSAAEGSPLASHRIASVEFRRVSQPYPRKVGKNAQRDVHGVGTSPEVVILKTDQGATGWGALRGRTDDISRRKDAIIGRSVADLIDPATGYRVPEAKPYDIPLHDLAGVILGMPVWKMISGRAEPLTMPIYSGMIYFDELEPENRARGIDGLVEQCRWDRDHGYRQFKVKIGRGNKWMRAEEGLKRDIDVVNALNNAFPDCELLVDANNGYSPETAIRFLEGIRGTRLFWFEEPFHETLESWRKLHSWMMANGYQRTRRADGEAAPDAKVLDELNRERVVDVRLEDILSLGFTEWRAFLPKLAAGGISASPHAWGTGVKSVYTGHLAAALGNVCTVEGVTCGEDEVLLGNNRIAEGRFHASDQPGFGLRIRAS